MMIIMLFSFLAAASSLTAHSAWDETVNENMRLCTYANCHDLGRLTPFILLFLQIPYAKYRKSFI